MTAMGATVGKYNLNFESVPAQAIEPVLRQARPGGWRRIRYEELRHIPPRLHSTAVWRVDLPKGQLKHPTVDYVFLTIDDAFPLSEPRVVAPQAAAKGTPCWPHVEGDGVLCLTATKYTAPTGARVLTMLQHSLDLMNMGPVERDEEFRREFLSYWSLQVGNTAPSGYALLDALAVDRDIYFHSTRAGQLVFADEPDELMTWFKNSGVEIGRLLTTRLVWPEQVPTPQQYPLKGRDIIKLAGLEHIERHVRPGFGLPVVLGFLIDGAPFFSATIINGASEKFLKRGFRETRPLPARHVASSFYAKTVVPLTVDRIDPSWIHGRDSNTSLDCLQAASVGIVGCGAIGGYMAHGLAQAGIGALKLVDDDELKPANLGRHVLGSEWLGQYKVVALAAKIRRDFPHIRNVQNHASTFQDLNFEALSELAKCNVLILAGLDLSGELAVDRWVATLEQPPTRVLTWTEEFALAGHAVALMGHDRFSDSLDADGYYRGRLTHGWRSSDVILGEAGCGVSFHPYDTVDMSSIVTMAQRITTDVILGRLSQSSVRMWLGNRDTVVERGGVPSESFDRSYCEVSMAWEP